MKSHFSIVGRTGFIGLLAGGLLAGACEQSVYFGQLGAGGGYSCVPLEDNNPCTEDVCDNGVPVHQLTAAGLICPPDGDPCTSDVCDNTGSCVHPALTDGSSCGAGEVCQSGMCTASCLIGGMFYAPSTHDPANACQECFPFKSTTSWSPHGGTFAAPVDYPLGLVAPFSVAAADLNGDGRLDLAVAASVGTVSVLLNNGNGTFAAKVDYSTGSSHESIAAADVNGDGKPDLATANYFSGSVSVWLNNGNGTFAANVDYPAGKDTFSVAAADLDGDGKPDLAVAGWEGSTVSVLLNNGNGTFAAKVDYPMGAYAGSVTAADLDGDGLTDLAVTHGGLDGVSVLLNTCVP